MKKERPILMATAMVAALLGNRKTMTRRVVNPQPQQWPDNNLGDSWLWHGGHKLELAGYGADYVHSNWTAVEQAMLKTSPYVVGQRLWVKETFYCDDYRYPNIPQAERTDADWVNQMMYFRADGDDLCQQIPECECENGKPAPWRPSIFMPRWASRISLEITDVRVEWLQEITEEDAKAEGCRLEDWRETSPDPLSQYSQWTGDGNPAPIYYSFRNAYRRLWDRINGKGAWDLNPCVRAVSFKRVTK